MLKIGYLLIFWIVACVFIIFENINTNEIQVENELIRKLAKSSSIFIKGIPAILASLFVLIMRSTDSLFFFILVAALFFCFAGDIGIEKDILVGLPLFLITQLLFCLTFLCQVFIIGPSVEILILSIVVTIVVVLYMFMFLRYLESSETGLGDFKIPVVAYCIVISLMFVSSFLLWGTLAKFEAIVVVLGASAFVISDSIIGIHEFHHKISKNVL
ncbi:MAG: lysoplasmalogenase [Candidatus Hodarchaeota archaeon]